MEGRGKCKLCYITHSWILDIELQIETTFLTSELNNWDVIFEGPHVEVSLNDCIVYLGFYPQFLSW